MTDGKQTRRRHERFVADIPCRLFIPSGKKNDDVKFEAFLRVRDLSFGGAFVKSDFHFRNDEEVHIELKLPGEDLPVRGRVVRRADGGMGIAFEELDAKSRAAMLRHFVPESHKQFHATMTKKLMPDLGVDRVSLILHLWEDWKQNLPAPPIDEPAPRTPSTTTSTTTATKTTTPTSRSSATTTPARTNATTRTSAGAGAAGRPTVTQRSRR